MRVGLWKEVLLCALNAVDLECTVWEVSKTKVHVCVQTLLTLLQMQVPDLTMPWIFHRGGQHTKKNIFSFLNNQNILLLSHGESQYDYELCEIITLPLMVTFWFDLIWFDLIWFDLIWFDLIWFDLIWFDLFYFILFYFIMNIVNSWDHPL